MAIRVILSFLITVLFFSISYAQIQPGEKTPGFITSTLDGQRIALKDYWEQKNSKAVVLSFFATWCQPCKEDLKYLQKMQAQYGHLGLQIICVLTQDSSKEDAVKKFMQSLGVTLPVLLDEYGIIGKRYLVTGLPCNYLIDKEGILKAKYLGYSEAVKRHFEGKLKELIPIP